VTQASRKRRRGAASVETCSVLRAGEKALWINEWEGSSASSLGCERVASAGRSEDDRVGWMRAKCSSHSPLENNRLINPVQGTLRPAHMGFRRRNHRPCRRSRRSFRRTLLEVDHLYASRITSFLGVKEKSPNYSMPRPRKMTGYREDERSREM